MVKTSESTLHHALCCLVLAGYRRPLPVKNAVTPWELLPRIQAAELGPMIRSVHISAVRFGTAAGTGSYLDMKTIVCVETGLAEIKRPPAPLAVEIVHPPGPLPSISPVQIGHHQVSESARNDNSAQYNISDHSQLPIVGDL